MNLVPPVSLLPQILGLTREPDSLSLALRVPLELAFFRGHFPGLPILPGVVQVHWAMAYAREYLAVPTDRFVALQALKFQAPIGPGQELTLKLTWQADIARLDFVYAAGSKRYATGRASFAESVHP